MDRIATLNEILTENPKDAFARYGLAMEYSKQGDFDRALAEFAILLESHPEYTAGYFMAAQTLVRAERLDDAKKMLGDGIASARRTGNMHAQSEMEGLLAEVVLAVGDAHVTSIITANAVRELQLKKGDTVAALIKSTDVMIERLNDPE